ncbi:MAG: sodium:alanine symporter family protein [Legionellales bacterium]|nr:sodium:alanine symporter family protein [Legionellales bacterium]OUX66869.1 MAG: sodium:alanine symporter family protein [bacterium TMED178]
MLFQFEKMIKLLHVFVWGPPMMMLLLGVGIVLMIRLRCVPLTQLFSSFKALSRSNDHGDITPLESLMTILASTVGIGNIAGIATAIAIGGPGALFWMNCAAIIGMATAYSEAYLAVKYREKSPNGEYIGGPMYYIQNGLKKPLQATLFAIFGTIAGLGIVMVQSNTVAQIAFEHFSINELQSGLIMAVCIAITIIGGIKQIAKASAYLVPLMSAIYIIACMIGILLHVRDIPGIIALVIHHAFEPTAASGGFLGASIFLTMQMGIGRGIFSNEAGLGSTPILHACAKTNSPHQQRLIGALGPCIDTLLICNLTGLVILLSGFWNSGINGAELTARSMSQLLPLTQHWIVSISVILFAFTSILGWYVYSERCLRFLAGEMIIRPYQFFWIIVIPIGASMALNLVWLMADIANALMAIPNLIALYALRHQINTSD